MAPSSRLTDPNNNSSRESQYIIDTFREVATEVAQARIDELSTTQQLEIMRHVIELKSHHCNPTTILATLSKELFGDIPLEKLLLPEGSAALQASQQPAKNTLPPDRMLTRQEVSDIIGRTVNTVTNQVQANRLVGYFSGDNLLLPAWQFANKQPINGLREVLEAMNSNGITAIGNIRTPLEQLNGQTIYDLLLSNQLHKAIEMAKLLRED